MATSKYSWFCREYRPWRGKLDLVMRHTHRAGEKLFIDYTGQTVPVIIPDTGEVPTNRRVKYGV